LRKDARSTETVLVMLTSQEHLEYCMNRIDLKKGNKYHLGLVCICLVIVILAVYIQVCSHEFLNFDDYDYVTNNTHVTSGISGQNIIWAFTSVEASNWHPITWISHMIDVQLYGMNPSGHHFTNVVFHTISSVLLLLLLYRCTGLLWQSSFVAALFALHPMHVESVAWVAERKDVLSALFWFLTLLLYAEYMAKRKPLQYILTLSSFVLGLLSKPMLVTLPIVMLLMDFWPFGCYQYKEQDQESHQLFGRATALVLEKIPFFVCSFFSAAVTIYAQNKGGAIKTLDAVPIGLRIENTLISYVKYIARAFWPQDMAVLYPMPLTYQLWQVIGSILVLFFVTVAVIRFGRRCPYLPMGWSWFLVTLVPVIGIITVGSQSMADRYSYIPFIGLFIMAAWGGGADLMKGLHQRKSILALFGGGVIIASAALTWQQLDYWRDNISLYNHTLEVTTGNFLIYDNLGSALDRKGYLDAAIQAHREAIRINPNYAAAYTNLGVIFERQGSLDAAIQAHREALRINPNFAEAHYNLGACLERKGSLEAAIQEYRENLRITPDATKAHVNLGVALAKNGNLDAAIREFQETLRIDIHNSKAHDNLGVALDQKRMQSEKER